MQREWLLKLSDLLESLPIGRFDYGHWVGCNWEGKQDLSCGTTACAAGWATTIPELREQGLVLEQDEEVGYIALVREGVEIAVTFGALSKVFDLEIREAIYLFRSDVEMSSFDKYGGLPRSPPPTASATDVAQHLRNFVRWHDQQLAPREPQPQEPT